MKNNVIKIIIILVVIGMVVGIYFIKQTVKSKDITSLAYDEIINDKKVAKMVNFIAPNCLACEKMQGLMKEIISEYEGKASIVQIDIMENEELGEKYNIIYTPTQIFFDEYGNEISRHEGFIGKKDLVEKLASMGVEK